MPKISLTPKTVAIGAALALVMLITRSHHFGTAFSPPDASLAVFFLAGLWVASAWLFGGLLAVAYVADLLAFAAGVSDWCTSPAYPFLIPAYAAMWFAGRMCHQAQLPSALGIARVAAWLVAGSVVYFAISNGSFYWFSGLFADTGVGEFAGMSIGEFWSRTIKYFPWYLQWAAIYVASGLVIAFGVRALSAQRRATHATR